MLKNYLTIAIRNLIRHKVYSLINISGLAIGMACCLLIVLVIQDEFRFDRFHKKGDRIYRVLRLIHSKGGKSSEIVTTSGPLGPALKNDFPEVKAFVRLWGWQGVNVSYGDKSFGQTFCRADQSILNVFTFPLAVGDPETVLKAPFSVLVTEETARKYFGDEDPIGKVITVEHTYYDGDYTITGILKDIPRHSTIRFDFLTSTVINRKRTRELWETDWIETGAFRPVQTYIMLPEGYDPKALEQRLPGFMARYMGKEVAAQNTYRLQPLERIYLYSRADYGLTWYSDINNVYLSAAVAFFILLIACINFTNLSTARSANRAREVGLRKVVGAYRRQLIYQFLGESLLLSCLALLLALGLTELALPAFSEFVGKKLSLSSIMDGPVMVGLVGFTGFVALLAGSYPAFFLSAFQPVEVLKGTLKSGTKGAWFRKGLVIFQFTISVFLIIGTAVIYSQVQYMRYKDLGFDREQIVIVPIFAAEGEAKDNINERLSARYEVVKAAFLQHPNVLKATAFRYALGWNSGGRIRWVRPEGFRDDEWQMRVNEVDHDFLDTFGIELVAGRGFSKEIASDTSAFILNETAVKLLGWTDPIGKRFEARGKQGTVIGVVKDFHNGPLRQKIEPVVFVIKWSLFNYLALKIRAENIPETLAFFEETWKAFMPKRPFWYFFETDSFNWMYRGEVKSARMIGGFAVLAILVACLGLFGLASFTAEQRTKEIGIRKALGASVPNIVVLLSKEFVKLVIVANLIAWPVAFFTMNHWLQDFAYRIDLGAGVFVLGGILALTIALATVSSQAIKAAVANPVDALRYE